MEILGALLDFVLHVDVHLRQFVEQYGAWVYALLFLIVFVETGLVVMPFLPGDSLLFIVGALCGAGLMSYTVAVPLLIAAAVIGNQTNYTIGSYIGPRVFQWEQSKFFNKRAFERAHAFYEEYGGITLVAARFLPFLRTFAPFVAGVAQMTRAKFTMYDVSGGTLWVVSIVTAGYLFGNMPWVQTHMSTIIWLMIIVPGLLAFIGAWRTKSRGGATARPGTHGDLNAGADACRDIKARADVRAEDSSRSSDARH
ncbi:MAG TPA: VTT domain-containing protein [Burkholderiaceae bacterium]